MSGLDMDEVCELSSELVEYIVTHYTDYSLDELNVVDENGDMHYSDRVQDIFNNVLDLVDNHFNSDESEE